MLVKRNEISMQYHPQMVRTPTKLSVAMTPMIDVVFLLLIFFLCTATFQIPEEELAARLLVRDDRLGASITDINLPELEEVYLEARQTGNTTEWYINEGPTPYVGAEIALMLRTLAEVDLGLPVTIEPTGNVPLEEVVFAYDAARVAGFQQVQLVAEVSSLDNVENRP